jgi:tRNA G10  N-methylase Trm11
MFEYLFILGRTPKLSAEEIKSILESKKINHIVCFSSPEIFHIRTNYKLDTKDLIMTLGGVIKIALVCETLHIISEAVSKITEVLSSKKINKIVFGLSMFGVIKEISDYDDKTMCAKIKNNLEEKGYDVRYILGQQNPILSSVVVSKQKVAEFILLQEENNIILAETLAVQDFEMWNKRDFQRPWSNTKKGMIPLKVARIMINLSGISGDNGFSKTLFDPFCGMGTILQEGLSMKFMVLGMDNDSKSVEMAKKNIDWYCNSFNITNKSQILKGDATHADETLKNKVDLIVTEPYLGPAFDGGPKNVKEEYVLRILRGLEKLYIGCLRNWAKILKPNGVIVITFPSFVLNNREYFVKKVIDNCEKLGYSITIGPIGYFRPQAIVRRNIYKLIKNTEN